QPRIRIKRSISIYLNTTLIEQNPSNHPRNMGSRAHPCMVRSRTVVTLCSVQDFHAPGLGLNMYVRKNSLIAPGHVITKYL
ncbi:Unknown protein, partial [Striga hermonthica]